jgi:O-succinylbenzoic acid--CoA ligase
LHRALEGDEQLLGHLRECKAVLVGGGPLDSELRDRAEKAGIKITATYGMTESCGGVVYDGIPLEGVEVKIVDDRIALKGPQIALGYLGEEFPTIDGRLEVIGRGDDQIISGGEKISLGAIERFLQERFANPEIIAFSRPDSEWGERLCIATTQDFDLSEISSLLKSQFGSHAAPKELLKLDSIPYLSIGKPDRRRLADANS